MAKRLDTAPFYRRIITDAWRITWHHKQLWIFGFFATLLGFGGVLETLFGAFEQTANALPAAALTGSIGSYIPGLTTLRAIIHYSAFPAVSVVLFTLLFILLAAIFAWMTLVSVGALVSDTRKIARGGEPTFSDGVKAGTDSFWPLFKVNVSAKLVAFAALSIATLNLHAFLTYESWSSAFIYVGSYVMLAVVAFVAELVAVFGSVGVVVQREKPRDAMEEALGLISEHWLVMFELAVLLVLSSIAIAVSAALLVLVASVPIIFLIALSSLLGSAGAVYSLMALTAAVLVLGAIVVGSIVTTMSAAAWTLLWIEIAQRRPASIVHRVVHHLKSLRGKR